MATKDISDYDVLKAYRESRAMHLRQYPYEILAEWTGECEKVCYRAMERAYRRDLIDFGVSLRTGWLTEKGEKYLREMECEQNEQRSKIPWQAG